MKTEDHAWRAHNAHASAQLSNGFADRVLRATRGPDAAAWDQLQARAAAQLRPGFADRVLRAVRALPASIPSLREQVVFCTATAAVCLLAVVYIHSRSIRLQDERNLLGWQQLASEAPDLDSSP